MAGKSATKRPDHSMSPEELQKFLGGLHTAVCSTNGRRGWPHSVALWYLPGENATIRCWVFAKSQKVMNMRRDPRATLLLESGDDYPTLQGAMIEANVHFIEDPEEILEIGIGVYTRYHPELTDEQRAIFERQLPKRLGLRFEPVRIVTWDHTKL